MFNLKILPENTRVALFLASGFEEVEALTLVDLLRRAEIPCDMISMGNSLLCEGSHKITVQADLLFEQMDREAYQLLLTPGGLKGCETLASNEAFLQYLNHFYEKQQGFIGSICASPKVLHSAGLTAKHQGTSYPAMKEEMGFAAWVDQKVVHDQGLVTSQGLGTALDFALYLVSLIKGKELAKNLASSIVYTSSLL